MATQGPKSGRCGEGQAGVLRCRVAGLGRLHRWPGEARKTTQHSVTGVTPQGCSSEAAIEADVFTLRLEEDLGGKQTPLPHQVGRLGAQGRRSEVEFQSRLRCVPAHSAARAPRWLRGKETEAGGARETVGGRCLGAPGGGADTTPSAFGTGNNGTQLQ